MSYNSKMGSFEVITGCMFSGKSEELIRRIRRAEIAKQKVLVFKPLIDFRYSRKGVVSHSGVSIEAIPVENPEAILKHDVSEIQVVAIDEIQFFTTEIRYIIEKLVLNGIRVIAAGLDMDFRGEPFGPMPELMSMANKIDKLEAVCTVCGAPAYYTQRVITGVPASYFDPVILVGAQEAYEARCRMHHQVGNHPRNLYPNS
ncbi:MAG: Thymidine kinase [candidate division WS2 bacterium]|uniref:Thymidine kinase n=1 Tax=Psychracetigena formicireducens TaxID=2986056 RepID=A0A9E2BFT8_PSYF1|nr:Thymidine kinase [Candidatus Psychracetigena formicireducens]MBT9144803.1 Thymidine kinase [Candidatus Psychracetigena formicireducens]